ncbi:MAG: glycosyltransferase family 4 protein, partial [Planctomycetota bacterium]
AIDPGLDLERFQCPRDGSRRRSWGATKDDLVLGVVARMQTHRLFPELIEGFASVAREDPGLHLVILGRGTNRARVAHQPARASGVGERIHFPGHLSGEEYPRSLACFDALIFLVPGSDGTCRAAREALASGVPVIASRRGQLPELIHDRENGLLLEMETPGAIAQAIRRLRSLPEMRSRLAATAREVARARFDPRRQARRVIDVYRRVLEPGGNR